MLNDLRHALRTLRGSPGFTAIAVITLALGIGANTVVFSVVYGLLRRPLPYRDAGRLVVIQGQRNFSGRTTPANYSLGDLEAWSSAPSFESVTFSRVAPKSMAGTNGSELVRGEEVSAGFFQTVGGRIVVGRPLGPEDETRPHIVIGQRLWQRRFAGDPDAIGRSIVLDGVAHQVVGVAASSFQLSDARTEFWRSAQFARFAEPNIVLPGSRGFNPIARLKPGATIAAAQVDADEVSRKLATDFPEQYQRVRADVFELRQRLVGDQRPVLLVLFAAVSLVLIVASANVANLLLARQAGRMREIAIRLALGASRAQIARFSAMESAVLSLGGALVGLFIADGLIAVLVSWQPPGLSRLEAIRVDLPVMTFAALVAAATAVVVGALPAFQRPSALDMLRQGPAGQFGSARARRLRAGIAIVQLAASLVLMVGGALLGRSLMRLLNVDVGARTVHVAQAQVNLAQGRAVAQAQQVSLVERIIDRLAAMPGVEAAAAGVALPPNRTMMRSSFTIVDDRSGQRRDYLADVVPVTPRFFEALSVPLVRGRPFTSHDAADRAPVVIVSQRAAQRIFGDRDPIGGMLRVPRFPGDEVDAVVVGVVGDVKYAALDAPPDGALYLPYAQQPFDRVFIVARTSLDDAVAAGEIRRAIADVDAGVTTYATGTLDTLIADAAAQATFRTWLLGAFAALALVIAAIGLYGVVSYSAAQRTSEIAIRMAIGARPSDVLRLVISQGLRLAAGGIALGLGAALALARLLSALLYGVAPNDPWSFAGAALGLLVVTLVASYVPARRATNVDPLVALRAE